MTKREVLELLREVLVGNCHQDPTDDGHAAAEYVDYRGVLRAIDAAICECETADEQ